MFFRNWEKRLSLSIGKKQYFALDNTAFSQEENNAFSTRKQKKTSAACLIKKKSTIFIPKI